MELMVEFVSYDIFAKYITVVIPIFIILCILNFIYSCFSFIEDAGYICTGITLVYVVLATIYYNANILPLRESVPEHVSVEIVEVIEKDKKDEGIDNLIENILVDGNKIPLTYVEEDITYIESDNPKHVINQEVATLDKSFKRNFWSKDGIDVAVDKENKEMFTEYKVIEIHYSE